MCVGRSTGAMFSIQWQQYYNSRVNMEHGGAGILFSRGDDNASFFRGRKELGNRLEPSDGLVICVDEDKKSSHSLICRLGWRGFAFANNNRKQKMYHKCSGNVRRTATVIRSSCCWENWELYNHCSQNETVERKNRHAICKGLFHLWDISTKRRNKRR